MNYERRGDKSNEGNDSPAGRTYQLASVLRPSKVTAIGECKSRICAYVQYSGAVRTRGV